MIPPAPLEGEWLWDEGSQQWFPLVKTETGHPDVEATVQSAVEGSFVNPVPSE